MTVFGAEASLLDYGRGRYRVDLLVGDVTFEFDGAPFASVDEFLATIEAVQVVDAATWEASLVGAERHVLETDTEPGAPIIGDADGTATADPVSSSEAEAPPPGR